MTEYATSGIHSSQAPQADGCGVLLREARERAGLAIEEVAGRLKMPSRVLKAIEDEKWEQLGAPVFVRGQLRSYARLLNVDIEAFIQKAQLQRVQPAQLVSRSHTPRYQRVLESVARRAVYVVLTAAIAVPVWVAYQWDLEDGSPERTAALDIATPAAVGSDTMQSAATASTQRTQAAPVVASLTPALPKNTGNALVLRTRGDSWVQIIAPDGSSIEKGLLKTGEQRSFRKGEVGRVVLGNAAAVEVQYAGSTVDLTPYQRANVARFAVSSDGSLVPVVD